jgi:GH25 family lysozyme M1 (1,4-beta-N-acetylmuramidase)
MPASRAAAEFSLEGSSVIHGVDCSYAQGYPNWDAAAKSPLVKFVIARVAYGDNPADDDGDIFARNHDECKRLHIPFGCYMFYLFDEDPIAQAKHFIAAASGRYGQLRPAVDVEERSGTTGSVAGNVRHLAAFNAGIQRDLACQPIIYTNADTWNTTMGRSDAFAGHSLWVASFNDNPGHPVMPQGFKTWAIHQYSNHVAVPGFEHPIDADVVSGSSLETLLRPR